MHNFVSMEVHLQWLKSAGQIGLILYISTTSISYVKTTSILYSKPQHAARILLNKRFLNLEVKCLRATLAGFGLYRSNAVGATSGTKVIASDFRADSASIDIIGKNAQKH